jgi:hypothetical protein
MRLTTWGLPADPTFGAPESNLLFKTAYWTSTTLANMPLTNKTDDGPGFYLVFVSKSLAPLQSARRALIIRMGGPIYVDKRDAAHRP